ncbi:amino acid ABC transporter substrate-binding protein [Sutterella sp.]|uniref:amino acid ABC transporter substrate-binding protein n=1 Tax=Sutterella sp. TaxID=1981025 RepID=UPI0026DF04C1|nr:amino acid ABC transporter substrate-binding protein [Sutterella sp.]MDO5532710.1 amino acid ABC transporter substrate-binding protein [Sutterella sp.]
MTIRTASFAPLSFLRRRVAAAVAGLALIGAVGLTASPAAIAGENQLAAIQKAGVIRIGTEGVYAPYTYHDAKGSLTGYDVEVGREIAKKLGVKPQFVETAWDAMIAGLDTKRYDIVINQVTPTEERRAKYDFSAPYTFVKGALIVKKDNTKVRHFSDIKGLRAAQTVTSNWGKTAVEYGAEIVGVQDFAQSVQLVATGRADVTLNSELSTLDFLREKPDTPVEIVDLTKTGLEIAIPLRKGNPELKAAIDKALAELAADGTLSKLSIKFLGTDASKN